MSKRLNFLLILGLVVLMVLPFLQVYPIFIMKIMCYALFACSFNLLLGYSGLLSFGHAIFFGGAGYIAGHALKVWGLPTELGILFAIFVCGLMALVIGLLAIKRSGIYFAMITLAFAQMVYFFFLKSDFTGGEDGLQQIPRGEFLHILPLENDIVLYYVVAFLTIAGFAFTWRVIHSPFGQVLKAIRENEARTTSLGYDVVHFKLIAFVLSACLAGLAGSMKALIFVSASLSDVTWQMSGSVILMTLIGGVGYLSGSVIGALVVVVLENKIGVFGNYLSEATGWTVFESLGDSVGLVMGVIFIVCVLTFRRGIVGGIHHRYQLLTRKR